MTDIFQSSGDPGLSLPARPVMNDLVRSLVDDVTARQLGKLMADLFSSPPWNESWTEEAGQNVILSMRDRGDSFFVIREEGATHPIAVGIGRVVSTPRDEPDLLTFGVPSSTFHIHEVMVDKRFQGRGLASSLMKALLAEAKRLDADFVSSRTRGDNPAMLRVFRKFGFKCYGAEELEYAGVKHISCVLGFSENH